MSALSNKSFSHCRCVEAALPFSAVAQRLVKSRRRTRGTFMRALSNKSSSQYQCVEATLPFSAVAQRLRIGGKEDGKLL